MAKPLPMSNTLSVKYFFLLIFLFSVQSLLAQPTITSFSPVSGPVGTTVTITGTNFSPVAANNIVAFGSSRGTVVSASATSLHVTVPTGASYQPITVTTGNLTAYAAKAFDVTFTGGGASFAADSFSSPNKAAVLSFSFGTLIDDLDGDGKPDVVSLSGGTNLSLYKNFNTAGGTFYLAATNSVDLGTANSVGCLGDLDGDGLPDIILDASSGSFIVLAKNTSTSSALSFAPVSEGVYPTGVTATTGPLNITTADLDGNGKPDVIIANADSTITVYYNNSTATTISLTNKQDFTIAAGAKTVTTGDLNGDGKPDVIVTSGITGMVYILKNTSVPGTISLVPAASYFNGYFTGNGAGRVAVGDLDGDGKPDLAIVNSTNNNLVLYRNTGTGGSIAFSGDSVYSCGAYNPTGVAIGDIDGDGKPDLAVSTTDYGILNFSNTYSILAFKNVGSPGATSLAPAVSYPAGYSLWSIALSDMNGDGKPDMIAADPAGETFNVLLNQIRSTPDTIAPHIISFSPDSAATGTTITIIGTHLSGATAVSFGSVAAQSFTVVSDSLIHAIVGVGSTGYVKIVTPGGQDSMTGFIYIPPVSAPVITSFAPTSGSTGATIQIHGSALTGIATVSFGGVAAQSFSVVSDTLISAVVGTGASGQVLVTGPNGEDSLAGFTFVDPTTPSAVSSPAVFQLVQFAVRSSANNQPGLQWRTLNEQSITYYVIEHSGDSSGFTDVSSLKAQDTDSAQYSFTDPTPRTGTNYYRLKIEDSTGHFTYSNVIFIQLTGTPSVLNGYPNPANTGLLSVAPPNTLAASQFTLVDMNGRVLQTIPVQPNTTLVNINVSGLIKGVYKLVWTDGSNYSYQTILILK